MKPSRSHVVCPASEGWSNEPLRNSVACLTGSVPANRKGREVVVAAFSSGSRPQIPGISGNTERPSSKSFSLHTTRIRRFASTTENRGVPGSSPSLAIKEVPAEGFLFGVDGGVAHRGLRSPEGRGPHRARRVGGTATAVRLELLPRAGRVVAIVGRCPAL